MRTIIRSWANRVLLSSAISAPKRAVAPAGLCALGALRALLLAVSFVAIAEANHAPYQGFGSTTPGGEGQPLYRVTNLNDSGPGSLRDALSEGNRYIVFDVAGEIDVTGKFIDVKGAFVTIDGFTAPSPGITLKGGGLSINGSEGGHDIIIRGIRIRDAIKDGIHIVEGAYNLVIDHVSVYNSGDGNLDIKSGSHDITVSWSIFAKPQDPEKNSLISVYPRRVTLHHNLFTSARQRNPKVENDDDGTPAEDIMVDMRNNLIWDWGVGHGTYLNGGATGNVVNNFYWSSSLKKALRVEGSRAYVSGNYPSELNGVGTEAAPFPAPAVDTWDACAAAHQILADAGVDPLDAIDQFYLSAISLPACDGSAEPPPIIDEPVADSSHDSHDSSGSSHNSPDLKVSFKAPKKVEAGATISIEDKTKNKGEDPAGPSMTKFYLSSDKDYDAGDTYLGDRAVPPLAPGEKNSGTTLVTLPIGIEGKYYIIAVADADGEVTESDEDNNWTSKKIKIK